MNNKKNGKNILVTIGWLSVVLSIVFPIYLAIIEICMGVVLKRDYDAPKHGRILIVAGIIGFIAACAVNYMLLQHVGDLL
ncbi:hypothetical protein [Lysinibacillus sp. ZYM-1]|uniref:hypothetical protein n=1 Tax=Lysinibacillus sp. ZYM-1 TaxID=1681184 RepID=UPI0006CE7AD9|nr:hypothetical protein [Lysinibacillus sp. ZYM-1]KPN96348.1 hypothetical protein AO843_17330 [Lysinibacillus sp. ZYM-1]